MSGAEFIAWVALSLVGNAPAHCVAGARACPIPIHFAHGAHAVTLKGRMVQNADCCAYSFRARAGQTLTWSEEGADVRMIFAGSRQSDGPGLPNTIALTSTGTYTLELSPNMMADHSLGPFTLTIAIR